MAEQIPEGECYKVIQLDAIFSFSSIRSQNIRAMSRCNNNENTHTYG